MKKTVLLATVILIGIASPGQNLKKGALLGFHVMTVQLKPGVTMDEFTKMFLDKVVPAVESGFRGVKGYLMAGIRGENEKQFGFIWLFESEALRSRFFETDGSYTNQGNAAMESISPVRKELEKFGTYTTKYTDWLVQ